MVEDVAKVVARVRLSGRGSEDLVDPAGQQVALWRDHPAQARSGPAQVKELLAADPGLGLSWSIASIKLVDAVIDAVEDREERVGERIEDAVDDELLGARRQRVEPFADFVERRCSRRRGR